MKRIALFLFVAGSSLISTPPSASADMICLPAHYVPLSNSAGGGICVVYATPYNCEYCDVGGQPPGQKHQY